MSLRPATHERRIGKVPLRAVFAALAAILWLAAGTPLPADAINNPDDPLNQNYDDGLVLLGGAAIVAAAPVWVPYAALDRGGDGVFLHYPYQDGEFGYMPEEADMASAKYWAGAILAEHGVDGGVERTTAHLLLDSYLRLGADAEWNHLGGTFRDRPGKEMQTGDFNVLVRFVQHPHVQFRIGLGTRWLDDSPSTQYGYNFTYSADVQFVRPFVASAALDWGWIHDEQFFHGRVGVGALWRRWEAFAAFDYLDIDQSQFAGPMFGVRAWF